MSGKDHARINLGIWGDDDWLDLPPDAQHLYFVLWTSPALSYCGAGDWHPGRIAALAAGWTPDAVEAAGVVLSARRFLIVDALTDEFLLRSWIKWDGLWKVPNMSVSVANARSVLASRSLRGVVVHEVRKIRDRNPDSSSWKRTAVESMLDQTSVDPASLPVYNPRCNPVDKAMDKGGSNPCSNPSAKGWPNPLDNPVVNPGSNPAVNEDLTHTSNPRSNPGPTPAPAPTTERKRGAVSGERTLGAREESPLSNRCRQHEHDETPPPCGACRDARLASEAAEADRTARANDARRLRLEEAAEAKRVAIEACDMCDDIGYIAGRVCDHDPDAAARNRRGIDLVRRQLAGEPTEDTEHQENQ